MLDKLLLYLAFVLLGGAASAISVAIRYKMEGKNPVKGAWLGFAGGVGSSVFVLCIYFLGFFPKLT